MPPIQTPAAPRRSVKKSISLPEDLAAEVERRAAAEQRNFSSYIQKLVAADLKGAEESAARAQEAA